MSSGEQIVQANGVDLCLETFGAADDPAVLLVHGASTSMLGWEEELCERIAEGGRYVIRFDNRDTGRSVSYPPGQPGYSLRDLVADAVGILAVLGVERAHWVGRSMAGNIITSAALDYPDRVASLTFIGASPGGPGLPPMSSEFTNYVSSGGPDPSDTAATVDFIVGLVKVYSGGSPYFDEAWMRPRIERDVARTTNIASSQINHFMLDMGEPAGERLGEMTVPTLVVHGEKDPVFPLEHGQAMQKAIPGATLLVLDKAGHELPPQLWDVFIPALLNHTAG
jgi:pimeloyl-ACP methyl ester carboxylesterase